MNIEEKKKRCKDFINSSKFTLATYGVLMVFRQNIDRLINLIELHLIFLKRVESGDVKHNFPHEEITKIKHLVMVDVLSKIMILIESLLNLFDCFSRFPYRDIPQKMVRYPPRRIDGFTKRFQKNKVSFWKIAGFPRVKFLKINCGLTENETKLIDKILHDSCESINRTIKDIINFYQANKILYGKFKHGLLFMPGFIYQHQKNRETPDSFLAAFDKLKEKPDKLCFEGKQIYPVGLEWFNTYSILPFWDGTSKGYSDILSGIKRLSEHVIANHLLWAFNCGEDYLPTKRLRNGKVVVEIYLTKELNEKETQWFKEISQKVAKSVHFPRLKLDVSFNVTFSDEKLEKLVNCFRQNQSATIWKADSNETRSARKEI